MENIILELKAKKKVAEETYERLKNLLLENKSVNIQQDFENMSTALYNIDDINQTIHQNEYSIRRMIELKYKEVLDMPIVDDKSIEDDEMLKS